MDEIKNIKEIAKIIDKSRKLYVEDYESISMFILQWDSYYVICKTCGARSRIAVEVCEEKDKAIEAWNMRVEK